MILYQDWILWTLKMISNRTKITGENTRYKGECIDKENKRWYFYTNSSYQYKEFKEGKYLTEFKFLKGEKNKNYEVVKRLGG